MIIHFTNIVNGLKSLGKVYAHAYLVNKIFWITSQVVGTQSHGHKVKGFDHLVGSLTTDEKVRRQAK